MIKAIEIENFKCIGERQRIELAPITLLFGPNSVGKSTVIQALMYGYEILGNGNLDPTGTEKGGEFIDLGGFRRFVHNRDLQNTMSLRFELEHPIRFMGADVRNGYSDFTSRYLSDYLFDLSEAVFALELHVSWNKFIESPVVEGFSIDCDGLWICVLKSSKDGQKTKIEAVNWLHPRLMNWDEELAGHLAQVNERRRSTRKATIGVEEIDANPKPRGRRSIRLVINGRPAQPSDLEIEELRDLSRIWGTYEQCRGTKSDYSPGTEKITVKFAEPTNFPGIPMSNTDFGFLEKEWPGFDEDERAHRILRALLGNIVLRGIDAVRICLNQLIHLGPLRMMPLESGFSFYSRKSFSDSAIRGLREWHFLEQGNDAFSDHLLAQISSWLGNEDLLDTGYELEKRQLWIIEGGAISPYARYEKRMPREKKKQVISKNFDRFEETQRLVLREKKTGLDVDPRNLGFGVTQIIPVLVSALASGGGAVICIEQPEIHLHPRLQTRLGDLFIESALAGRQFILETHSEHLLLRLLRRVRESEPSELSGDVEPGFAAENLSVLFLERSPETGQGIRVRRLHVNDSGDFDDEWPDGFFDERNEELFL